MKTITKPEWLDGLYEGKGYDKNLACKKSVFYKVNSLFSFHKWIKTNASYIGNNSVSSEASSENTEFTGTKNIEDAYKILENGSPEILKELKTISNKGEYDFKLKHDLEYLLDVEGLFFDVGLVLSGEPECWFREHYIEGDTTQKVVQINISLGYGCNVKIVDILRRASKVVSIVKSLEDAGVQVSLNAFSALTKISYDNIDGIHAIVIDIKKQDEPINYQSLSSILHPSFFRRLLFRHKEITVPKLRGAYGFPMKGSELRLDSDEAIDKMIKSLKEG